VTPPRRYDMTRRRGAVSQSRERAVAAAYRLLERPSTRELGLEAIAAQIGVTRATLYNQFGSRSALLVELFGAVGRRAGSEQIYRAMRLVEPERAALTTLRESTRGLAREQRVIRKLFALSVLDAELSREIARAERARRASLLHLAKRLASARCISVPVAEAAALLAALTSFQAFEAFSVGVGPLVVERRLRRLLQNGLGLNAKGRSP
jgi:AcrR family transcriptional regulator